MDINVHRSFLPAMMGEYHPIIEKDVAGISRRKVEDLVMNGRDLEWGLSRVVMRHPEHRIFCIGCLIEG